MPYVASTVEITEWEAELGIWEKQASMRCMLGRSTTAAIGLASRQQAGYPV